MAAVVAQNSFKTSLKRIEAATTSLTIPPTTDGELLYSFCSPPNFLLYIHDVYSLQCIFTICSESLKSRS